MARRAAIPRWALVLALVLVAGGALRAERAIEHGRFLSTDERAYAALGVAIAHGHYTPRGMDDPLHWPPGTPLLFAVARRRAARRTPTSTPPRSTSRSGSSGWRWSSRSSCSSA